MASTSKRTATRAKRKSRPLAFPVEFRLRIVKLFLEERYSPKLLVEQFGISTHSIQRWVKAYRLHGAAGLEPKRPVNRKSRVLEKIERHLSVLAGTQKMQVAKNPPPPPTMSDQHNLLIERYDEIKKSLNLGYVDAMKILEEKYGYSDAVIQDGFKKAHVLQNQ